MDDFLISHDDPETKAGKLGCEFENVSLDIATNEDFKTTHPDSDSDTPLLIQDVSESTDDDGNLEILVTDNLNNRTTVNDIWNVTALYFKVLCCCRKKRR